MTCPSLQSHPSEPVLIDTETFYAGFLLALAVQGTDAFSADGKNFHEAFGLAIARARQLKNDVVVKDMDWMEMDPFYGVMPHAEELVAFGQAARMLSLANPELVKARIRYSKKDAEKALEDIGHDEWFKEIAGVFKAHVK